MLISECFAVGNSWYAIFKDENTADVIKNIKNFADKDVYETAGQLNNNFKTCMALAEM